MRRRPALKPDTFPFLAVLLCAMGSLILILLELDRRARSAAHERAAAAWHKAHEEKSRDQERRRQEEEERLQQILARHQDESRQLVSASQKLSQEEKQVRKKIDGLSRSLAAAEGEVVSLKRQREALDARTSGTLREIEERERQTKESSRKLDAMQTQRQRLSRELRMMEEALARLKKQKQNAGDRWSVVAYVGKRGLNRRPFYVECADERVIFHPDGKALSGFEASPRAVCEEVERRQRERAAEKGGKPEEPYWLILVRPRGIVTYYAFVRAVKSLDLNYGYEFIDSDWDLAFPEQVDAPAPVEVGMPLPNPKPLPVPGGGGPPRGSGSRGSGFPAVSLAAPSAGGRGTGAGSPPSGGRGVGSVSVQALPDGVGPPAAVGPVGQPARPQAGREGKATPENQQPPRGEEAAGDGKDDGVEGQTKAAAGPTFPEASTPRGGEAGGEGKGDGGKGQTKAAPGPTSPEGSTPPDGPAPAGSSGSGRGNSTDGKGQEPLRPGSPFGPTEWVLIVDCLPEGVRLSPSQVTIPLEQLGREKGTEATLYRTVAQLVTLRKAAERPGDPPVKMSIRFHVYRDGLRTYHQAYPILAPIRIEKKAVLAGD
jgi:hypothetical protein